MIRIFQRQLTRDVFASTINQLWRIVSGPISLIMIPLFISQETQGFWYSFSSVSALSVFADLGFTTIISQFAAHEIAFVAIGMKGEITGSADSYVRLSSLFKIMLKWMLVVSFVIIPIVYLAGHLLFVQKADATFWLFPWIVFCIGSIITFWNSFLASFFIGCNKIAKVQGVLLISGICQTVFVFLFLVLKFNLYALSFSVLIASSISFFLLLFAFRMEIKSFLKCQGSYPWFKKIMPLFWRYSVSWAGGYFSSQIFTPLVFQFKGAVIAGKVGITMSLINAIASISNVWASTNIPKLNMHVAKKEETSARRIVKECMFLSITTYVVGLFVVFVLVKLGTYFSISIFIKVTSRFLDPLAIAIFAGNSIIGLFVTILAYYLRAHKEEPYLIPSLISGALIPVFTFFAVKYLSDSYVFLGLLVTSLVLLPVYVKIYLDKKKVYFKNDIKLFIKP